MRRVAWMILAIGACTAPARKASTPEPPADVRWFAAIATDAAGRATGATAILPRDEVFPPEGWEDGERGWLLGFDDETTARGPADRIGEVAIAIAGPDDAPLATAWLAGGPIVDGFGAMAPVADLPFEVTAAWMPACPVLLDGPTSNVEASCRISQCEVVARQDGCEVVIDVDAECNVGRLQGTLNGRGQPRFDTHDVFGTCRLEAPTSGAAFKTQCAGPGAETSRPGCTIEVFDAAFTIPHEIQRVQLFGPAVPAEDPAFLVRGYLGGMTRDETALYVTTNAGAFAGDCGAMANGELLEVDPSTLEVRRRLQTPSCPLIIARTATGFVLVANPGDRTLHQLDGDGAVVRSILFDAAPTYRPLRIFAHSEGRHVTVFARDVVANDSATITYEADTLSVVSRADVVDGWDAALFAPETIAILDRGREVVALHDPDTGNELRLVGHGYCTKQGVSPSRIGVFGDSFFLTSRDIDASVTPVLVDGVTACYSATPIGPFVDLRDPVASIDGRIAITAYTTASFGPPVSSYLHLFEPSQERFLPVPITLGSGAPGDGVAFGRRVIVALPWAGELVAVDL